MNLTEWKNINREEIREGVKDLMRSGTSITEHTIFSAEELDEMFEETLIEDFKEYVDFEGEFNFEEAYTEEETGLTEEYDFEPNENGDRMDLEFEFDLNETDLSYMVLGKLRDALFAEDYELITEAEKAKVTFQRAGGKITKRKTCGKGFRLKGNKCVPQGGTQKAANKRKGIKIKRAMKAMGGGAKKKASIKAKITKKRVGGRSRNYSNT